MVFSGSLALAVQEQGEAPPVKRVTGTLSPEFARLELLEGPWEFRESHFDEKGVVKAELEGTEQIRWILDNRAISREYTRTAGEDVYRAMGTLTWDAAAKKYVGVWFDNTTTVGLSTVEAEWNEKTRTMSYTLESKKPDGSPAKHRIVERFIGDSQRVSTTYAIDGNKRTKLLEVMYRRTMPCPGTENRLVPMWDRDYTTAEIKKKGGG